MKAALILICDVPKYIKDIRKKYDYHKNIPIKVNIKKIWLMKKKDKDWYRSKTIFLK